jgi:hypothetical protein
MKKMKDIIYEDKPFLLKPSELFMVQAFAKNQVAVKGDFAEVGVFKGATAKAICEVKRQKPLHLFDTFEGLPKVKDMDKQRFKEKMFKGEYEEVKKKMAKYPNVHLYKGLFPKTGKQIAKKRFAFVHLDVDLYTSTKACLEFFYPKMSKNGIIMSHDYHAAGVKKAFDEFFKDKPDIVVQLALAHCIVTKR